MRSTVDRLHPNSHRSFNQLQFLLGSVEEHPQPVCGGLAAQGVDQHRGVEQHPRYIACSTCPSLISMPLCADPGCWDIIPAWT